MTLGIEANFSVIYIGAFW